jgi:hypothetical protein
MLSAVSFAQSGSCGENLTWTLSDDGTLSISGEGAMSDFGYAVNYYEPWANVRDHIKTVIINYGVTYIGSSAFFDCTNLISVSIPNSVTDVGSYAFGQSGLRSLTIPSSITSIGDTAFGNCGQLTSLIIPESVTNIGSAAFHGSGSLTSVTIPNSVTSIGSDAFSGSGLTTVNIPAGVMQIESGAFGGCSNLTEITVDAASSQFTSIDGLLYTKALDTLIQCPSKKAGAIIIPDGVTSILRQTFGFCREITSVVIPNSVKSIGLEAFWYCTGLTSVTIGNGLESIESYAFSHCDNLSNISIATDNPNLTSVDGVVYSKNMDTAIVCPGGKTGTYTIPYGVSIIAQSAFGSCKLETVILPNTITYIGIQSFAFMEHLRYINIPASVTYIDFGAFMDDGSLVSIHFPASVEYIGDEPLRYAHSLTEITVDENNAYYTSENGVLFDKNKTSLIHYPAAKTDSRYIIPASVTTVKNMAFNFCHNLTSIILPNKLTTLESYAFYRCDNLPSIILPASLVNIQDYAFVACDKLTSITNLNPVPQTILSTVFSNVNLSDATLYVPSGSKELYDAAPVWQDFGRIFEIPSPHWQADNQSFQSTMTFTSAVVFNGTELQSPLIEIGAFSGDECRGSAMLKNFPEATEHPCLAFLTVHGNGDETITLRVYNHETGEEYEVTNAPVTFLADAIHGNPSEPYTVNITDRQTVHLSEGWNWISVNVANDNPSLIDQFKENINGGIMLKGRNEYIQAPGWIGTLYEIANESMYMVNTTVEQTLPFTGAQVDPAEVQIPLLNGWNWIGYTPDNALTVSEALAGLNPQIDDQIKSYSDYSIYTDQGWTGSLSSLLPGNGYKYYSGNAAPQMLTYSETAPQNAPLMYGSPAETPDRRWTAATHKYPNNMTVTSVVVLDDVELSGNIEIGAFCGDECRGSTLLRNIPPIAGRSTMGFLVIYGDSSEEIRFRVYDHSIGEEYPVAASLRFVPDAIHGTPGNPYRIEQVSTGIDNPATWESIDLIEVIDLKGRILLRKTDTRLQSVRDSSLSPGVYLLKLTHNGQTRIKKFVK